MTPVVLLSASVSKEDRLRAYEVGADDFIGKPFDHDELRAKVRVQFRLRAALMELADVFDALTSVRVYKSAFEPSVAQAMIEQEEGEHFDPAVIDAFREGINDFLAVRAESNRRSIAAEPIPVA